MPGRALYLFLFSLLLATPHISYSSRTPDFPTLIKVYDGVVRLSDDEAYALATSILERSQDPYEIALAHYHIGYIKKRRNDLSSAKHYIEAIHLLEDTDTTDLFLELSLRKNLGVIYKQHGDIESGIRYYQEAIPFAEAYDKTLPFERQTNVMSLKYNMANAYSENYNPKAVDMYLQLLGEAKSKGTVLKIAQINNQLGILFEKAKEYDLAIEHFSDILEYEYALPNKKIQLYLGYANENLGETYFKKGQIELASKYLIASLDYFEDENKFNPLVILTELYLSLKDEDKARKYGEWAMSIYPEIQKSEKKLKIFELMADLTTTEEDQPNEYLTRMLIEQRSFNQDLSTLADLKDKENLYRVVDSYYRELEASQRSAEYREWIVTGCAVLITIIVLTAGYFMIMDKRRKKELAEGLSKDGSDFKYY